MNRIKSYHLHTLEAEAHQGNCSHSVYRTQSVCWIGKVAIAKTLELYKYQPHCGNES
jgi:hypothetical protein